nr:MAG TPA: hypothetical protein [Caudoviricetes sp.]
MSKELTELIKELGKIVDGNQSIVEEMDKLKSLYEQLKVEVTEEFEYPFEEDEPYWVLYQDGSMNDSTWSNYEIETNRYDQGNIFKTKQAAERERDKRALLTRFRQFRDKCNGDWKPESEKAKYYIFLQYENLRLCVSSSMFFDAFNMFGYFKNCDDADRALELFGDEIKRLWV